MTTNTAGPWELRTGNACFYIAGPAPAKTRLANIGTTFTEQEEVGRLMSAAPDLLESERANLIALKNIRGYLAKHANALPPMSLAGIEVLIDKTRAVIEKAGGLT